MASEPSTGTAGKTGLFVCDGLVTHDADRKGWF